MTLCFQLLCLAARNDRSRQDFLDARFPTSSRDREVEMVDGLEGAQADKPSKGTANGDEVQHPMKGTSEVD